MIALGIATGNDDKNVSVRTTLRHELVQFGMSMWWTHPTKVSVHSVPYGEYAVNDTQIFFGSEVEAAWFIINKLTSEGKLNGG